LYDESTLSHNSQSWKLSFHDVNQQQFKLGKFTL